MRELNVGKIVVNGDTMTAYLTRKGHNFEEKVVRKVIREHYGDLAKSIMLCFLLL